jgi:beta-phosphoglucomutase
LFEIEMSLEPEALVFDFDGVLADTEPLYWKAWSALLEAHGIPFSWKDYCKFGRGVKDEEMLATLPHLASRPSVLSSLKRQLNRHKEMVRDWTSQRPPIGAPTVSMLKSLTRYKTGLVTSSEEEAVEPILRKAGIYECFQAFVFRNDVKRHKPDPEPYLRIRMKLGVQSGIAFEDSDAGLQSGAKAGFRTIRVAHPSDLPEIVSRALNFPEP